MHMTFRWYGEGNDTVTLEQIRQIPGVEGIVWALHNKQPGEIWEPDEIREVTDHIKEYGFNVDVVESVNVHDEIKIGLPTRDKYIENYKQTLRNLKEAGVKVVCYNFMPVFDWTRTDLFHPVGDGSTALYYEKDKIIDDPKEMAKYILEKCEGFTMPGRECDIKLAIHQDDPPWDIFGLPRLLVDEPSIDRFLKMVDDPYNCLTLCSGSLSSNPKNNVADIVRKHCDRIAFAHIRNVKHFPNGDFSEASHRDCDGDTGILDIVKAYHDCGFTGYVRPDHGRHIWGEKCRPGYGLYDRALGIMYLLGCFDTLEKFDSK